MNLSAQYRASCKYDDIVTKHSTCLCFHDNPHSRSSIPCGWFSNRFHISLFIASTYFLLALINRLSILSYVLPILFVTCRSPSAVSIYIHHSQFPCTSAQHQLTVHPALSNRTTTCPSPSSSPILHMPTTRSLISCDRSLSSRTLFNSSVVLGNVCSRSG